MDYFSERYGKLVGAKSIKKYGLPDDVMNDCFPGVEKLGVVFTHGVFNENPDSSNVYHRPVRFSHRHYWARSKSWFIYKVPESLDFDREKRIKEIMNKIGANIHRSNVHSNLGIQFQVFFN